MSQEDSPPSPAPQRGSSGDGDAQQPVGDQVSDVARFVGRWWVLHTRSRNEKVVAEHLTRGGVQHFLPLVGRGRHRGLPRSRTSIPLFPGYVFLCGGPEDREKALKTNRVANVLDVADQERLRRELSRIERVVSSAGPVGLYPRLKTGCRCRVTTGSLIGLEGVVVRRPGPWRVYVGVAFLGQSAELEIDPSMLEVLD